MNDALLLEPVDAWSFRDGRPFEAGESFEAQSVFPPFPWTVLGCLRTTLLRKLCPDPERYAGHGGGGPCSRCATGPCVAEAVIGRAGEDAPFAIGPPLLVRLAGDDAAEAFYPAPRDLVREGDGRGGASRLLSPIFPPDGVVHSLEPLRPVGAISAGRVVAAGVEWLSRPQLVEYLAGRPPAEPDAPAPGVWREPRIGVAIDPATRGARQGQLYLRDVVRLEDGVGLLVRTTQTLDLDGELGRLGGDGRLVRIRRVRVPEDPSPPRLDGCLKVYFASPTWFAGDWRPAWINPDTLVGVPPGADAEVRLVGAATGDPVAIGGWDLKNQRPRQLKRLVGAGSVYFLELMRGGVETVVRAIHGRPLCDDQSMAKAGFGLAFVGRY